MENEDQYAKHKISIEKRINPMCNFHKESYE